MQSINMIRGLLADHGRSVSEKMDRSSLRGRQASATLLMSSLAMRLIKKHGHASNSGCLQAACNGLIIKYYPRRSPRLLTVNAPSRSGERCSRVLTLEWKNGDAWRVAIITYRSGSWESRLRAIVHPRPWLERWRAVAISQGHYLASKLAYRDHQGLAK